MNRPATAAFALLVLAGTAQAQPHDHSIVQVGRDSAGMLHMHTHDAMPFAMEESIYPGIVGFASAEVALESLINDHPAIGLFTLDPGCDIRAVLISQDPGIQVIDSLVPLPVGGEMTLGAPYFHYMPTWNIYDGEIGEEFTITLKFRDASGLYADSEPFDLRFVAVPAPTSVLPLLGLVAVRRRR